jgi:hypothetical protein
MSIRTSDDGSIILGKDKGITISSAPASDVVVYDESALVLFAAMVPEPSDARKLLLNNFIVGCKADVSLTGNTSNWTECDLIFIRAAHSSQPSTLNLKNPALFQSTYVDDPTFTADSNVNGNGVGYVNLNWAPSSDGVKYTLNSASMSIYNINEITEGQVIGAFDGNRAFLYPRNANLFTASINSLLDINVANESSSIGHFGAYRQTSTTQYLIMNGVVAEEELDDSSAIPTGNVFECGVQVSGNPIPFSSANAASHYGSGYVDMAKLYARFNTYLTAVGAI